MENSKDSEILEKLYDAYYIVKKSGKKTTLYTCKGKIEFEPCCNSGTGEFASVNVKIIDKKSTPNEALVKILELVETTDNFYDTNKELLNKIKRIARDNVEIVK